MLYNFCREIVETMVKAYKQRFFNGQMPVFDGRKNLYSRDPLPIGREKVIYSLFFVNAMYCLSLVLLICNKLSNFATHIKMCELDFVLVLF